MSTGVICVLAEVEIDRLAGRIRDDPIAFHVPHVLEIKQPRLSQLEARIVVLVLLEPLWIVLIVLVSSIILGGCASLTSRLASLVSKARTLWCWIEWVALATSSEVG